MARFSALFFVLLMLLTTTQCSTTEEIWIHPDRSIRRELTMDMSTFMPLMKMSLEQEGSPADSPADGYEDLPEDQMRRLFSRSELDTVISFADMMAEEMGSEEFSREELLQRLEEEAPDMTADEKDQALRAVSTLLDTDIRLRMSDSQRAYSMTFMQEFADGKALNEGADLFESLAELAEGARDMPADEKAMGGWMGGGATYDLTKKTLSIRRPAPDLSELRQDEEMGMLMPMLENMENQLIIHVPKKVKRVNLENAEIDGNTVRVRMPAFPEEGKPFELELKYK